MAREERICINCVTPLKKESKQLGTKSVWWVCPECGLRERETSQSRTNEVIQECKKRDKKELEKQRREHLESQ